jgi:4-diphosphocytidyl-2-C-methyl-D-erythritol kinase
MQNAPSAVTAHRMSPAKVNLCLRIVGRRADGYHLLDSIFAAIDFCDRIDVRMADVRAGREVRVRIRCDRPDVPNDATNLAARAASMLLTECGLGADVDLSIAKRIPPGTGLGGGSSNAATVLSMMNEHLRLGVAPARLHALALQLGADVPFFLTGGCARVRGIGERVDRIRGWPGRALVVALPPVSVATAWAFRTYTAGLFPDADEAARMASQDAPDPSLLRNDLETVVLPNHPEIARLKASLIASGAAGAVMSGSGSAVVGLVADGQPADAVASALRTRHPEAGIHVARILAAEDISSVDPTASYA